MDIGGFETFFAQHMDGNGQFAPGWSDQGRVFVSAGTSSISDLNVISDGAGGAIGAFTHDLEVWAHRLYGDGTTSALPSLYPPRFRRVRGNPALVDLGGGAPRRSCRTPD
jgi:hypothetical protein